VSKASADKSVDHQAREWRKLHEEIRGQSTIHSSVDDELKDRVKKLADSAEQEVALEEAAYAKTIDEMKKEGEALIEEEERAGQIRSPEAERLARLRDEMERDRDSRGRRRGASTGAAIGEGQR